MEESAPLLLPTPPANNTGVIVELTSSEVARNDGDGGRGCSFPCFAAAARSATPAGTSSKLPAELLAAGHGVQLGLEALGPAGVDAAAGVPGPVLAARDAAPGLAGEPMDSAAASAAMAAIDGGGVWVAASGPGAGGGSALMFVKIFTKPSSVAVTCLPSLSS